MLCSSKADPNPRRVDGWTEGPPISFQASCSFCPFCSPVLQAIRMQPSGRDNAPYFTALVVSSLSTIAMATAALGLILRSGPDTSTRWSEAAR